MARAPFGLTVSYLTHPDQALVTDPQPALGWALPEGIQSAYQIVVTHGSARTVVWDSARVASSQAIGIRYAGRTLVSDSDYTWRVRVWTGSARPSAWSAPQDFRTGTLGAAPIPTPENTMRTWGTGTWGWPNRNPLVVTAVTPERVQTRPDGSVFVDFGRAWFGTLALTLPRDAAPTTVTVHFGERLARPTTIDRKPPGSVCYRRAQVALTPGVRTVVPTPPAPFAPGVRRGAVQVPAPFAEVCPFRAVEVEGWPGKLTAGQVRLDALHSAFDDRAAAFTCSDKTLEGIWQLCHHTFKATSFLGVSIDGERERTPYEADAYIAQLGHCRVERDWALYRWTLEYLLEHSTWPTEWAHHLIFMAEEDAELTGDTALAARLWDKLDAKLLRQKARPDGLLVAGAIVDWPPAERDGFGGGAVATDNRQMAAPMVNSVTNAFYWRALTAMARLAQATGKPAAPYTREAERVRAAYWKTFWDPTRGVFVDGEGSAHVSLHANLFPLAFGLVPQEHRASVLAFLKTRGMACSVYAAQYLLEALFAAGDAEAALALMVAPGDRSWRHMPEAGATMTMEAWDARYKPNLTFSHAWGAAPANLIPRGLFGLRPLEPGYGKVAIAPQSGGLAWAKVTVPTIRGPIQLAFDTRKGRFAFEVALPGNVIAEVTLPGEKAARTRGPGRHRM